jgi:hypothetical protein
MLNGIGQEKLLKDKYSSLASLFEENEVFWILLLGPYSHHLIYFISNEWAQYTRVFHCIGPERFASNKHLSLLGSFVSFKENEVFWIWLLLSHNVH